MEEIASKIPGSFVLEREEWYKNVIDCIATGICPKCGNKFRSGDDIFDYTKTINGLRERSEPTNRLCPNCD